MKPVPRWVSAIFLSIASASYGAQDQVDILHHPIECWPTDEFLQVDAAFMPPQNIKTAKFYLRSTAEIDYYYAEFTLGPSGGRVLLPKAQEATPGVSYYIELVTGLYTVSRTEERIVDVDTGNQCKRRDPETAFYNGQNPDIAMGATRAGATPLPPGFKADGIARFLNATGVVGDTGGGLSGKTIAILGGVGGGAAAALALAGGGGGSDTTTSSPVGGGPTTASSTTTTTAGGGSSSTTTTVVGGGSTTISPTTTVAGGSTTTVTGSTTTGGISTSTGPTTSTLTTSIGTTSGPTTSGPTTSIPTTTSPTTSPTTSIPTTTNPTTSPTTSIPTTSNPSTSVPTTAPTTTTAGAANLRVTKSGPGTVAPNTQFSYTVGITNVGSATATAVEVEDQLPATFLSVSPPNLCAPFPGNLLRCFNLVIPAGQSVTLTIRVQSPSSPTTLRNTARAWWGNPRQGPAVSNTVSTSVRLRTDDPGGERIAVKTFLDIEPYDGRSRGRVVFNGSEAFEVLNQSPVVHHVAARDGDNTVEGTVLASPDRSRGFWRFDFSAAGRFDPGSLRVESGQVYSMDDRSVTFSVAEGSLVRFRYGIRSDSP